MKVTCPECKRRIKIKVSKSAINSCRCGHTFSTENFFDQGIYLIDSNVFIYAKDRKDRRYNYSRFCCNHDKVAATDAVINEVRCMPVNHMRVFTSKKPSEVVSQLRTNNIYKQPSPVDLSILQTAIERPEIDGIITYDKDFKDIAAASLVSMRSKKKKKFWVGDAFQFFQKMSSHKGCSV